METFKEKILDALSKKGNYDYGIIGWVSDQFTAGELCNIQVIREAVIDHFADDFLNSVIEDLVDDVDCGARPEIIETLLDYSPPEKAAFEDWFRIKIDDIVNGTVEDY